MIEASAEAASHDSRAAVLVWSLGDHRFAIPLNAALEVTPVAALTEGVAADGAHLGHLDLRGAALPCFSARRLLGIEERKVVATDRYLIARVGDDRVALLVDRVDGIEAASTEAASASSAAEQPGVRLARVADDGAPLIPLLDLGALIAASR